MTRLRAEGGCPWDREQDLRSLRPYLIEEAYEVLDEMERVSRGGAWTPLCEELGDLLFQVVFHAQLAREVGEFSLGDVATAISNKLESRHPHVFGTAKLEDAEAVLNNWSRLKAAERKKKHGTEGSVLDGVPTAAPALQRAERLTEKASRIGFDWPDLQGVRAKLDEELAELDEAIVQNDRDALEHELGDVLFSLANLARFIKTPPEDALRGANRRFTTRFQFIEAGLRAQGIPFGTATLEQMDALWNDAKVAEKREPTARHLPRARVVRVEVPVPALEPVTRFWNALAPTLGWTAERASEPGTCTYGDEAWRISFTERSGAVESALMIELDAPSVRAVETMKAGALQAGATLLPAGEDTTSQPTSVTFADPAGVRWRYACSA